MFTRKLIVKFYLWFLLAMTLTVLGAAGTFALFSDHRPDGRPETWAAQRAWPVKILVEGILAAGVSPQQMAALLTPLLEEFHASLAILSREGEPLVVAQPPSLALLGPPDLPTPAEVAAILEQGVRARRFWWSRPHRFEVALAIRLADGQPGVMLTSVHPHPGQPGMFPLRLVAGLGALLGLAWLLCWPLAAYLARPLKRMAAAADALGEGRLDTRIEATRKDEIGRLAERFNAMAANLQGMVEGHKQLLADISHELRSPLARQRVALELARQEQPGAAHTYLDQVEHQIEALDELIGQLLAHARLEAMPHGLRAEQVRPEGLVREEIAALDAEARAHQVTFHLEHQAGEAPLLADRQLLKRALANGLGNGIAHAPPGSTVRVTLLREEGALKISIADQGPGVAPEMLEKIFHPFFRADSARSRATGGVGLGLAITRRAMEAHGGGAAAAAGAGGKGFVLKLWLPWREAKEG